MCFPVTHGEGARGRDSSPCSDQNCQPHFRPHFRARALPAFSHRRTRRAAVASAPTPRPRERLTCLQARPWLHVLTGKDRHLPPPPATSQPGAEAPSPGPLHSSSPTVLHRSARHCSFPSWLVVTGFSTARNPRDKTGR